jgi:hypothetical protein
VVDTAAKSVTGDEDLSARGSDQKTDPNAAQTGAKAEVEKAVFPDQDIEDRIAKMLEEEETSSALPNVDELNATLDAPDRFDAPAVQAKAPSQHPLNVPHPSATRSSGFIRGFLFALITAGALVALYVFAPDLSARFPGLRSALDQYVADADQLRTLLNDVSRTVVEKVTSLVNNL